MREVRDIPSQELRNALRVSQRCTWEQVESKVSGRKSEIAAQIFNDDMRHAVFGLFRRKYHRRALRIHPVVVDLHVGLSLARSASP